MLPPYIIDYLRKRERVQEPGAPLEERLELPLGPPATGEVPRSDREPTREDEDRAPLEIQIWG